MKIYTDGTADFFVQTALDWTAGKYYFLAREDAAGVTKYLEQMYDTAEDAQRALDVLAAGYGWDGAAPPWEVSSVPVKEAAAITGLTQRRVLALIHEGRLRAVKTKRSYLIDKRELEKVCKK